MTTTNRRSRTGVSFKSTITVLAGRPAQTDRQRLRSTAAWQKQPRRCKDRCIARARWHLHPKSWSRPLRSTDIFGMTDREEGIDEDYLVVGRARIGPGSCVEGFARRPVPWVARHLKHGGALISSGIMVGYAGVFAAQISKNWPGVSKKLSEVISAATITGEECEISSSLNRGVPPAVLHSLRWHPPAFPQRVFNVCNSGWSGLKSAGRLPA